MSDDDQARHARTDEAVRRAGASLVLLELGGHTATGFVLTCEGHVVTSLHAVASARSITAVLPDGLRTPVVQVAAVDERRDLALLRLSVPNLAPALALGPATLPTEGEGLHVLHARPGRPSEARALEVRAVQVLGDWLTLLELSRTLPEDASGAPVLDARGQVVGLATAALANGRALGLVIPARYISPLLENPGPTRPLSALDAPRQRATRVRHVPQHAVNLLEGCATPAVESVAALLGHAINVGAPAYNRGDVEGCYRLYAHTAEQLIDERDDCPGVQRALRDGLLRCESLPDAEDRAWALRDTFDGLMDVIGRWRQARPAYPPSLARRTPPKTYLN
ncbi:serine protease [Corallococcus sp. bb12-1]|uniref:S1 family peptidase n=1 Tax=Corallococcus sp. bb12-1 TaxID=2996784 RepID=UPI002271B3E5|nr:serine protease [Corallococcus sp. bb12-1]MCY1045112.1 serine protease [Corallococcus sp. bb12-1]